MGMINLLLISWDNYRVNFKTILKAFIYFTLVPSMIAAAFGLSFFKGSIENALVSPFYSIPLIVMWVVFDLFLFVSLIYLFIFSKKKSVMSFKDAFNGGLDYFWKYIRLGFFLILLLVPFILLGWLGYSWESVGFSNFITTLIATPILLLVIPSVIFGVYWIFSPYIIMKKGLGAWQSAKQSKSFVKDKWWKIFGYAVVIYLLTWIVALPFETPDFIINLFVNTLTFIGPGSILLLVLTTVISSLSKLITYPISILFFKNLYLELNANAEAHNENVVVQKS